MYKHTLDRLERMREDARRRVGKHRRHYMYKLIWAIRCEQLDRAREDPNSGISYGGSIAKYVRARLNWRAIRGWY